MTDHDRPQSVPIVLPYAVVGLVAAVTLLPAFFTFQTDWLILPLVFIVIAFLFLLWTARTYPVPVASAYVLAGGLVVSLLTLLVAHGDYYSIISMEWMWVGILLFLILSAWARQDVFLRTMSWWMIIVQVVIAAAGWWTFIRFGQRATGFQLNANGLGGVLLWGVLMVVVLVLNGVRRRWTVPALVIILSSWLLTISLTAFVAAVIPILVLGWWFRRQIVWKWVVPVAVLLVVGLAAVWFVWKPPRLVSLMSDQHISSSWHQRVEFDRVAIKMWEARPWTGWGLGRYQQVFPRFTNQFLEQPLYAHNLYLQILAETGIFGALGWLAIVYFLGWAGLRSIRLAQVKNERLLLQGLFVGWLAFSIHAALDFAWYFPAGQIWWVLVSAVFVCRGTTFAFRAQRRTAHMIAAVGLAVLCLGVAGVHLLSLQPSLRGQRAANTMNDDEAISQLERAVRLTQNPIDVATLAKTYWLRRQTGDLDRGEQLLRQALQRNPDNYFLHDALGMNLVAQDRLTSAIPEFATTHRLEPWFHPDFTRNYVLALKNAGRDAEARDVLYRTLSRYGHGDLTNPILQEQLPVLEALRQQLFPT